jgi:kynurenine formamidase
MTISTIDPALTRLVRQGTVYDLEQPRFPGMRTGGGHKPPFFYALHMRHEDRHDETHRRTSASGFVMMDDHSGTHVDAICHQAYDLKLHGGVAVDSSSVTAGGFTQMTAEHIAPIVCRGVLIDVAASQSSPVLPTRYSIAADDLAAALRAQGSELRKGDAVLVRTGSGSLWRTDPHRYDDAAGVGRDANDFLGHYEPSIVGSDNVGWDSLGTRERPDPALYGHVLWLIQRGVHIIENMFLEELSRHRVFEFLFVCPSLKIAGATGGPVRPIAIV